MTINSSDNKYFKLYKSLLQPKGIKKNGLCLVSGRKIVPEIWKDKKNIVKIIGTPEQKNELNNIDSSLYFEVTQALFSQLDTLNTDHPLLVYSYSPPQLYDLKKPPQGLEILCSLGDPSNLGALLRSCEAFSVNKVILLKNASHPFLPKAIKTSSGSCFRVPLFSGPFIDEIPSDSFYALDKSGDNIFNFRWPQNLRLLMGEEGPGHPNHQPKKVLSVPMSSSVESLNATVATSIALSIYHQQIPVKLN